MNVNTKNGFTLIELILFLGVGGLLFVGILAGSGMAVAGQRYRDSVQSLQGVIQQQYSEVANVVNDRENDLVCNSDGEVSEVTSTVTPRGTSADCVIMGRYMQSHKSDGGISDGQALHVYPVIAAAASELPSHIDDDTAAFRHYSLKVDTSRYELERVEWDNIARARTAGAPDTNQFSILILRSPLSGIVRTYSDTGSHANNLSGMLTDTNLRRSLTLCVDMAGSNVLAGERMAVRLAPGASNQGGVEMISHSQGNGC